MLCALTGYIRWRVRTAWAIKAPAPLAADDIIESYNRLNALAHTLERADRALCEGRISVAEHEATWWLAYDATGLAPASQPVPPPKRRALRA